MNKNAVQWSIIGLGISSGILLLIYLPLLIWSPPWSINGYYTIVPNTVFGDAENGYRYSFYDGTISVYEIDGWVSTKTHDGKFIKNTNGWTNEVQILLRFENNNMFRMRAFLPKKVAVTYYKVTGPFAMWQIKWSEWTSD